MTSFTVKKLQAFESKLAKEFSKGKIRYPVHLCGGNEAQLIDIFKRIKPYDWVFSTHRNHYHALLKGIPPAEIMRQIRAGRSMTVCSREHKFFSTGIVCGGPAIAVGVAWALNNDRSPGKVWCFIGDGAQDQGRWVEAQRYADGYYLPLKMVIEDNDRSVETSMSKRWGRREIQINTVDYKYKCTVPHVGVGKWVSF